MLALASISCFCSLSLGSIEVDAVKQTVLLVAARWLEFAVLLLNVESLVLQAQTALVTPFFEFE